MWLAHAQGLAVAQRGLHPGAGTRTLAQSERAPSSLSSDDCLWGLQETEQPQQEGRESLPQLAGSGALLPARGDCHDGFQCAFDINLFLNLSSLH